MFFEALNFSVNIESILLGLKSIYIILFFLYCREMVGPSTKEQWMYWSYPTEEQKRRAAVKSELENILKSDYVCYEWLSWTGKEIC